MAKKRRIIEKYRQPCFDSTVFLGKLNEEICRGIKRHVVFDWLWRRAKNGYFKVFISAITLAEVYKTKLRTGQPAQKIQVVQNDAFLDLIEQDFVEVIEISRRTALLANALCRQYNVYPSDGLQLASALEAKCDTFIAWDRPLIGKTHSHIRIEEPSMYDPDMFEDKSEIATKEEIEEYERQCQIEAAKTNRLNFRGSVDGFIKGEAAKKSTEKTIPKVENKEATKADKVKRSDA